MPKRLVSDFSLWLLLLFNLYLIWYYEQHPSSFKTLVWLYWLQSVMIGVFNAVDIFTLKKEALNLKTADGPLGERLQTKGCLGLFFLLHYGGFHLVYAIFLLVQIRGPYYPTVFLTGAALIFIDITLSFFKRKRWEQQQPTINVARIFFSPYLRIIPMHLMIMGPALLGWSHTSIFLWLKMATDVLMYIFINRSQQSPAAIS